MTLVSSSPDASRRTAVAGAIMSILRRAIINPDQLAVELDGDRDRAPAEAAARIRIHGPDALARLLWPPTLDTFAEAYLRGEIEIDGEVAAAVAAGEAIDMRRLSPVDLRRLARWTLELQRETPAAPSLRRRARLAGPRHSRARDLAAVRFHYDVGEDFFGLWLDPRMTYSCGYFGSAEAPARDLDGAQEAKLDLVCHKLDLQPGQRLLDIGCGWGSLILFAAERCGVEAVGVTLSERQATEANRRAAEAGLGERARAEVRDYRDLGPLGTFDAVASIGMFEHVGARNLATYFRAASAALRPDGLFLNHGIARSRGRPPIGPDLRPRASRFIDRYVFPDGELVPAEIASLIARSTAGLELIDHASLRPHYALTLRAWVERLEASWDRAVDAAGEEVARTWRLYMSAARLGFERGELDVVQLLFAKPLADGSPAPRPLRPWW